MIKLPWFRYTNPFGKGNKKLFGIPWYKSLWYFLKRPFKHPTDINGVFKLPGGQNACLANNYGAGQHKVLTYDDRTYCSICNKTFLKFRNK